MNWVPLDRPTPAGAELAPILAHLTHEILSVATAQAGLLSFMAPLLTDDPELGDHLAATVRKLRLVADDLRIVRLLHAPTESTHTASLQHLLDRVRHAYPHLALTLPPHVDLTSCLPTHLYDLVTLVIRLVESLTTEAPTPIRLCIRPQQQTNQLVVTVARAGIDSQTSQTLRQAADPTAPSSTLPIHAQLLTLVARAEHLDSRIRIIRSIAVWRLALPSISLAT